MTSNDFAVISLVMILAGWFGWRWALKGWREGSEEAQRHRGERR